MKKLTLLKLALLSMSIGLTACSSDLFQQNDILPKQSGYQVDKPKTVVGETGDENSSVNKRLESSMDEADKSKLFHALDKAPGKSTHWENESTGIGYTVVPTKKVVINGNPYCREYMVTATRGSNEKEFSGTACVGDNATWQAVSN